MNKFTSTFDPKIFVLEKRRRRNINVQNRHRHRRHLPNPKPMRNNRKNTNRRKNIRIKTKRNLRNVNGLVHLHLHRRRKRIVPNIIVIERYTTSRCKSFPLYFCCFLLHKEISVDFLLFCENSKVFVHKTQKQKYVFLLQICSIDSH